MNLLPEIFNTFEQAKGSAFDQIQQAIGTGILIDQVPKRADELRDLAGQYFNEAHDAWDPALKEIEGRKNDFEAEAFGHASGYADQFRKRQAGLKETRSNAQSVWDEAKAGTDEIRSRIKLSEDTFERNRQDALKDMKQTNVYDMESANGANQAFIQQEASQQAAMLKEQGLDKIPGAIFQANQTLKARYTQRLADTQKALNSTYLKERANLHAEMAKTQAQLQLGNTSELNESLTREIESGKWATATIDQTYEDEQAAFSLAAQGAAAAQTHLNSMSTFLASTRNELLTNRANIELKAEELMTVGLFAVANKFMDWDISIPQINVPQGNSGGGGGSSMSWGVNGGLFSFGGEL